MLTKARSPGAIRRQDVYENDVVIDGERGDGSAIGPDQVVLTPTFSVAFEGEIGIIGDDVAVHVLHTFLRQRISQLLEHPNGMVIALGVQRVG